MEYIKESLAKDMIDKYGMTPKQLEELDEVIKKYHDAKPENHEYLEEQDEIHKEANWLIYKYNQLLQDDNIKEKDQVREWFYTMTQPLIINGVQSYIFLYCESILPAENLKEVYHISDEDDKKYRNKYQSLDWFDNIKISYYRIN